jgi:hypothetical protein
MKFTVVLRYPKYSACQWPDDMYFAVVEGTVRKRTDREYARIIEQAQKVAFAKVNEGRPTDEHLVNCPEDLEALVVISGEPDTYCPL